MKESPIERYLSNRMNPDEQERFLRRLRRDHDLARHVEAERIMMSAVAKNRGAMPQAAIIPNARTLQMLASTPPLDPGTAASGIASPARPIAALIKRALIAFGVSAALTTIYVIATRDSSTRTESSENSPTSIQLQAPPPIFRTVPHDSGALTPSTTPNTSRRAATTGGSDAAPQRAQARSAPVNREIPTQSNQDTLRPAPLQPFPTSHSPVITNPRARGIVIPSPSRK